MKPTIVESLKIKNPSSGKTVSKIILALDKEFIFGKKKKLSLKKRYPGLFERKNYKNLFFVGEDDEIFSFVAIKTISVKDNNTGKLLKLFFVGCVYTPEMYRGNGYSSLLLKQVSAHYMERGFDAGILWTSHQGFYKRLGWKECENGKFFAMCSIKHDEPSLRGTDPILKVRMVCENHSRTIERLRLRRKVRYIINRKSTLVDAYKVVPSPVTKLQSLIIEKKRKRIGYCIAGIQSTNVFVYEIICKEYSGIKMLLRELLKPKKIKNIYMNLPVWQKMPVDCKSWAEKCSEDPQRLAMVFAKSHKVVRQLEKIYIPFIDRI